jgi:hypothetical protein
MNLSMNKRAVPIAVAAAVMLVAVSNAMPVASPKIVRPDSATLASAICPTEVSAELAGACAGTQAYASRRAVNYNRHRVGYRQSVRHNFPYSRLASESDPFAPGSGTCSFGSYVACFYSGTFCWQRCY